MCVCVYEHVHVIVQEDREPAHVILVNCRSNSSNFGTEFPHNRSPSPKQGLFSSQNKTGGLPL